MLGYKSLLFLAFVATYVSQGDAHLTQLCSATSAAHPGRIDFYFGTYHSWQKSAPGSIILTNTGGTKLTAKFNQNYKASPTLKISTPDATRTALIKAVNNANIIDNKAIVNCYTTDGVPANKPPPKNGGAWIIPAPKTAPFKKWGCHKVNHNTINMWTRVSINKATSGDWKFEMHGTDQVYDPSGAALCALSKKNPRWIGGMAVADGTKPCKSAPPVGTSIDKASVAGCAGLLGGALCTSGKCSADLKGPKMTGTIKCEKGKWQVTQKCTGKPTRVISKCESVADKTQITIKINVNTQQTIIDQLPDGSKCPAKGGDAVTAAKKRWDISISVHKKAVIAVTAAASAKVTFDSVTFSSLVPGKCGNFWQMRSYISAKATYTSSVKVEIQRKAEMKAFKKAYDDAVAAAKKAVRKCQCTVRANYNAAWAAATIHVKQNELAWRKAAHLLCVHRGTITLHKKGHTLGLCKHTPCPTVKPKKLHAGITALTEKQCKKGVHFLEDALLQMDHEHRHGEHQMPDGTWMDNNDMQ